MINVNADSYIRDQPEYEDFIKKINRLDRVLSTPVNINVEVPYIQYKSVLNGKMGNMILETEEIVSYHFRHQKSRTGKWMGSHTINSKKISDKSISLQKLINMVYKYAIELERIEGYGRGNSINIVRYSTEHAI